MSLSTFAKRSDNSKVKETQRLTQPAAAYLMDPKGRTLQQKYKDQNPKTDKTQNGKQQSEKVL